MVDGEHLDRVDAQLAKCGNFRLGEKKRRVWSSVPIGRMATAEDLTVMAIFLAGDQSAHLVAQTCNGDDVKWMS